MCELQRQETALIPGALIFRGYTIVTIVELNPWHRNVGLSDFRFLVIYLCLSWSLLLNNEFNWFTAILENSA